MPYARFTNIGTPTRTSVSYQISTDTISSVPSSPSYGSTYYVRGNYNITCTSGGSCTTTTCTHGVAGQDAMYTVNLSVSCTTYYRDRSYDGDEVYFVGTYSSYAAAQAAASSYSRYRITQTGDNQWTLYQIVSGGYTYYWDILGTQTLTDSFQFYPPPKKFSFTNLSKGSKIGNTTLSLSSFFTAATKWKRWKAQSTSPSFPYSSFCNSNGYVSAGQISSIYLEFGKTSPYKQGDTIGVAMFQAIANLIDTDISN